MKIIFWGTPEYAVPTLESLIKSHHDVIAVITQPDKKRKRGNIKTGCAVKKYAEEKGLKVYTSQKIRDDNDFQDMIIELNADIFVVIAFGQILPKRILDAPKYGCWNGHASLLPRWRGAGPIQWAILSGDSQTGVGIMYMEEGLDTGPVLIQEKVTIDKDHNLSHLTNLLSGLTADLFTKALGIIEDKVVKDESLSIKDLNLTKQSELGEATSYARMIKKSDYMINWNKNSVSIHRQVNGLYPHAFTFWKGKRIKILQTKIITNEDCLNDSIKADHNRSLLENKYKPGDLKELGSKELLVKTEDGFITVSSAQIEGKKAQSGHSLIQQLKGDSKRVDGRLG